MMKGCSSDQSWPGSGFTQSTRIWLGSRRRASAVMARKRWISASRSAGSESRKSSARVVLELASLTKSVRPSAENPLGWKRRPLDAPGGPGEHAAHDRLEGRQRHGVVAGIESHLVPLGAELDGLLKGRMAAELLAGVPVLAVVMKVVIALEDAVMLHDPMGRAADIGLQQRRREVRVIFRRQHVADIVQEARGHGLLVRAAAKGAARGHGRKLRSLIQSAPRSPMAWFSVQRPF